MSLWTGSDEFTCHNDRIDAAPLPLPSITEPVRVVIVRHGQSTWNAEGRIQGSTDLSVLSDKGVKQAEKTRDMLSSTRFSQVFQSPLTRARQTADVVLQGQPAPEAPEARARAAPARLTLPALREIDLYHFQGLLKHEGKALYGEQYKEWHRAPHSFVLDGHAPVRELWYRGSLAWQSLLAEPQPPAEGQSPANAGADPRVILVVAHNAINQALVATALGIPPPYFRRLPQNNAALSVFDLQPGTLQQPAPRVTLSCLNQSPDNPFKNPDKVVSNVVLLTPPRSEDPKNQGAELRSLAHVLSKLRVTHVLAAPSLSAETVRVLLKGQESLEPPPASSSAEEEQWLPSEGQEPGQQQQLGGAVVESLQGAGATEPAAMWERAVALAAAPPPGDSRQLYGNVLVVLDEHHHVGMLWVALGLSAPKGGPQLRVSPGGLSVIEFAADPRVTPATVRCINNTAHLAGGSA